MQYHVIRLIACSAKVVFVADKGSYREIVGFVQMTICVVMHWWLPYIKSLLLPTLLRQQCLSPWTTWSLPRMKAALQIIVLKKICSMHCSLHWK